MEKQTKDSKYRALLDIGVLLAITTAFGFFCMYIGVASYNAILFYILAIVATAIKTEGHMYTMLTASLSVLFFNFFFLEPHFSLVSDPSYIATFAIVLIVAYIVSTLTVDIKKAEEEKVRLEERAKREAFQANLLRAISHDLRTPLAGISGNANVLLSHGEFLSEETKREIYGTIEEDSLWLNNLVENLLSISRMSQGSEKICTQVELIADIVDSALEHIDRRKSEYRISTHYEDEFLLVKADARLLVQVVINIVNNAIKYTPEGSSIDIYTERVGDMVETRIEDNGPGISEEARDHIFEQFYTEGKLDGDSRRGLGLGLYLCKSIIENLDGTIVAYNVEPHGACFAFRLPVAELELD